MKPLPFGLTAPLHIGPPLPWSLLFVLALLLLGLFWLWRRRRRKAAAGAPAASPPPPPATRRDVLGAIQALRKRYRKAGPVRRACHELSSLLRAHFEWRGKLKFSTLTSGEIGRVLGDSPLSRFFRLLSDSQFGRGEPSRKELLGLCEVAEDLVRSRAGGEVP